METKKRKVKSKARMWDELPWHSVDIAGENLGDFEDAVFMGLEEVDGNDYIINKSATGFKLEAVSRQEPSTSVGEDDTDNNKSSKKENNKKKRKAADASSDLQVAHDAINTRTADSPLKETSTNSGRSTSKKTTASLILNAPSFLPELRKQGCWGATASDVDGAGAVPLCAVLCAALERLGFRTPTPIQAATIPTLTQPLPSPPATAAAATSGGIGRKGKIAQVGGGGKKKTGGERGGNVRLCDVVGAAETGSGKTMAFMLPILNSLLQHWGEEEVRNTHTPHSLVVAPTRELALQIATVTKEISTAIAAVLRDAAAGDAKGDGIPSASALSQKSKKGKNDNKGKVTKNGKASKKVESRGNGVGFQIEVVSVIGGMSEHKQRRQLSGLGKPVHIVIATPGRLVDLMEELNSASGSAHGQHRGAFEDMSRLRFLVVDEADRMMEDGHFSELHRIFNRIRDHEAIVLRGEDPVEVNRRLRAGIDEEDGTGDAEDALINSADQTEATAEAELELQELVPVDVPMFPSEEELQRARDASGDAIFKALDDADDDDDDADDDDDDDDDDADDDDDDDHHHHYHDKEEREEKISGGNCSAEDDDDCKEEYTPHPHALAPPVPPADAGGAITTTRSTTHNTRAVHGGGWCQPGQRQTLLFSATAVKAAAASTGGGGSAGGGAGKRGKNANQKRLKLNGTLQGLASGVTVPDHMKELLALVGIQKVIKVIDVTSGLAHRPTAVDTTPMVTSSKEGTAEATAAAVDSGEAPQVPDVPHLLPKGLKQLELHVPSDEKDVYAYYYLLKHPGRCILFTNSIKTARRLDGLFRALGIHCRPLHAQMQQRQRLRAVEAFQQAPMGVLVATDVAARGLDVHNVQHVIHYDAARSPQVYIHRSGRTARANLSGTAISLVSPEDALHHKAICTYLRTSAPTPSAGTTTVVAGADHLPRLKVDLFCLPLLRQRIAVAKKLFTENFVASRGSSEMHWLQRSAQEADLPVDEQLAAELGGAEERATETQMHRASKTARNTDKRPDRADEMDATTEEAGSSAKGSKRRRKDKADKNIAMESADDEGIAGGRQAMANAPRQHSSKQRSHLEAQLRQLLDLPLPDAVNGLQGSSQLAAAAATAVSAAASMKSIGAAGAVVNATAAAGLGLTRTALKKQQKAATNPMGSWKKRSSFFVYAPN